MNRLLQSAWFVPLIGGLLYLGTTAALIRPSGFQTVALSAPESSPVPAIDASWNFRNPEFDQWLQEIKQEKDALASRAQQLQELQKRLDAERQEILVVTQTVHQLQVEFDKNVVRLKQQEVDNLKREVKILTSMSPEGAAAMLNEMPEEKVVAVLFMLKPDAASVILDTLSRMGKTEAKRAAELTERMRTVLPPEPAATSAAAK